MIARETPDLGSWGTPNTLFILGLTFLIFGTLVSVLGPRLLNLIGNVQLFNEFLFFPLDVIHLPSRRAVDEEVLLVHDPVHLDFIKSIPVKPQTDLNKMAERLDSIYLNPDTYDCALLSAGSLLAVVDAVCQVGVACCTAQS